MVDKELPNFIGGGNLLPPSLSPEQENLCNQLDALHNIYSLKVLPSNMFRGAIFASRNELRSNPDWISQAANSLREILYPFYSVHVQGIPTKKKDVLKEYGSARADDDDLIERMGRVYGLLNGLTHHGNVEKNSIDLKIFTPLDFEKLLKDFERVMHDALARQLDIHQELDQILTAEPGNEYIMKDLDKVEKTI